LCLQICFINILILLSALHAVHVVTDRPQETLLNRHVIDIICATGKWIDLGKQLLSEDHINDIDVLETNESNSAKVKCSKIFKIWLDTQHGASWRQLIEALHRIDLSNLADELNSILLQSDAQERMSNTNQLNVNISVQPYQSEMVINGKFCV